MIIILIYLKLYMIKCNNKSCMNKQLGYWLLKLKLQQYQMRNKFIEQGKDNNKFNSYVGDFHLKNQTKMTDSLDNIPRNQNYYESRFKIKKSVVYDRRSSSQMNRKLESIQFTPNRLNHTPNQAIEVNTAKNNLKIKLPRLQSQQNQLIQKNSKKNELDQNRVSLTLQMARKKKLKPLKHQKLICYSKTKAGTNGQQIKINQDAIIIQNKFPFGLKMYCICDGHGLNGHHVSNYIKLHLIKNLNKLLKKQSQQPENIIQIIEKALSQTNQSLLNSEIDTDLSGSTLVAVFIFKNKIYTFNVGDSRAILISEVQKQWKCKPLSIDQKPDRIDQRQRIQKAGGRIQAQKDEKGNQIGPLRVWISNIQLPGLAMTRSFGDKAGIRAGTNAKPEILVHEITKQDKFFIVASDGIWQYIQNEELMQLLIPFYEKQTLELGCERAMNYCTSLWRKYCLSRDDISLIVVLLNQK